MQYPLNELFQTLQGEGYFTGVPAIFIRLQGCPVGCSWCDTKHTWEQDPRQEVPLGDIAVKTADSACWASVSEQDIVDIIMQQGYTARHVVITGGEPCIHDLYSLTQLLEQQGFSKPVRDFVGVIAANRRLRALRQIVAAFADLVAQRRGIITAHVASAHPLNDLQRQQLRARLIEAGYGNVNIHEAVEPDLLGGLVVRIGARLYDTSLKSRLQRLQYAMKGAA